MPFTILLLANGQLAATVSDMYSVPAATTAIVKTITLVNTGANTQLVNAYLLKSGGTARRIIPVDTSLPSGYSLETDEEYTLGAGDKIQGSTTSALVVDFTVNGVQET